MASFGKGPQGSDGAITALLSRLSVPGADPDPNLISQLYEELRRLARHYMRRERGNHTLQPTALVNEAYARLLEGNPRHWQNRTHFLAVSAQLMRCILVDHARARIADKRGGVRNQVTIDEALLSTRNDTVDVLALNEVLERLALLDARQAHIVELHFFGGLGFDEVSSLLQVSESTVKREWGMARAWLKHELSKTS